ncbi:MAG: hypothetical protein U1F55_11435 [Chitinivorax sp.]
MMITDTRVRFCASTRHLPDAPATRRKTPWAGQPKDLLRSDRYDEAFYQNMQQQYTQQARWQGEIWERYKNGQVYAQLLTITAVITLDQGITHLSAAIPTSRKTRKSKPKSTGWPTTSPLTLLTGACCRIGYSRH